MCTVLLPPGDSQIAVNKYIIIKRKIRIYMIMISSYVLFNFVMNFLLSMQWSSV